MSATALNRTDTKEQIVNQTRRNFWKFFAAAPVAVIAPLVGAKALPEIDAASITIEGENVMLSNCVVEGAGISIKSAPGASAAVHGCYIKNIK